MLHHRKSQEILQMEAVKQQYESRTLQMLYD